MGVQVHSISPKRSAWNFSTKPFILLSTYVYWEGEDIKKQGNLSEKITKCFYLLLYLQRKRRPKILKANSYSNMVLNIRKDLEM